MREVRTCDFCAEDATGVYEVVPASAVATADARRMLLCDGCRDTLASVVDPLLDALDGDMDNSASPPGTDGASETAEPESTDAGSDRSADPDAARGDSPARADASGGEGTEAGGRPVSERGPPRGYRKVMRFLENRELPMDRGDAEELVADAYGMGHEEVSAAIDHAVKHGRLRDVNGELRR